MPGLPMYNTICSRHACTTHSIHPEPQIVLHWSSSRGALLLADRGFSCSWMPVSCCAGSLPCLCRIAVDRGLFVDLADKMAKAVQNLQPKLNIWTTGTAGLGFAA